MLGRLIARVTENSADDRARPITIVALGDSVTMGCMADGEFDFENVYHARLKRMLQERYPGVVFNVINSGVAGDTAAGALSRLERDVLRYSPDVVLVSFGLNDSAAGPMGVFSFKRSIGAIFNRLTTQVVTDVVVLTPNFFNTRDNDRVSEKHRQQGLHQTFMERQQRGVLKAYAQALRETAYRADIDVADVYMVWQRLQEAGVDTTAMLANGLNHPTAEAHRIPAELLLALIDADYKPTGMDELAAIFGRSDA